VHQQMSLGVEHATPSQRVIHEAKMNSNINPNSLLASSIDRDRELSRSCASWQLKFCAARRVARGPGRWIRPEDIVENAN
jgi:hypothetical protein